MRGKLTWFPETFSAARQEQKLVKNRTATRTTANFISTLATTCWKEFRRLWNGTWNDCLIYCLLIKSEKKQETPFKILLCFTMTHWQIMMCSYFIHAKSAQRAWISFMLLNKHGRQLHQSLILDWRILLRKSSKILGKPDEYINASNSLSCLTQSLNSVFQLNFDHSILFTVHACI